MPNASKTRWADGRQTRMNAWLSDIGTIKLMWADGYFGEPNFYRRTASTSKNWIFLTSTNIDDPNTDPIPVWIGKQLENTIPIIIYFEDKYYFYVFSDAWHHRPGVGIKTPFDIWMPIDLSI